MSQVINGTEHMTVDELEQQLGSSGLSDIDKQKARLEHQRRVFRDRTAEARRLHPNAARIGSILSAVGNFGETAGLGLASTAAAGVTAAGQKVGVLPGGREGVTFREQFGLNRDRAQQALGASPVSQTVGTLGAFVAPTGAQGVARAGFRAAGGTKLAELATSVGGLVRVGSLQLASALTGSAGAITAINAAEGLVDERSLTEVAFDAVDQTFSGVNLGLSVGLGGAASVARARPDRALIELTRKAERLLPGFKTTPDMLRPEGGFIGGLVDSLSVTAAGRRAVADYMKVSFFEPLKKAVDDIRRAITPRGSRRGEDLTTVAARDIRGLLVGGGKEGKLGEGVIGQRIQKRGAEGFAESERAGELVSRDQLTVVVRAMRALENRARRQRGTEGPRGAEFKSVISDKGAFGSLRNMLSEANKAVKEGRPHNVTPQMLDNLRQRIGKIANFEAGRDARVIGQRDVRDAKVLYRTLRETERRSSPPIDRALRDIAELRAANAAFKPLANKGGVAETGDDIALVRSMFTAKDFSRRWREAKDLLSTTQLQRIRGAYLAEFFEEIALRQGVRSSGNFTLNARKMEDLFRGKGGPQFRRTVFDQVLPGVRKEITDLADVSDLVMKTIGRAEGSATARRVSDAAGVVAVADTVGMAVSALKDPALLRPLTGRLLGAAGVFGFTESLINGRVAQALNRAATGQPLRANRLAGAAATQAVDQAAPGLLELGNPVR